MNVTLYASIYLLMHKLSFICYLRYTLHLKLGHFLKVFVPSYILYEAFCHNLMLN